MSRGLPLSFGTSSSVVVTRCQVCNHIKLDSILFLGYLPPVNAMFKIGTRPHEQSSYPAELLYCPKCHLVQLGLVVDPKIIFPKEYPYTSSTTKILRDNFSQLYKESLKIVALDKDDLVIDIGSNDGNLLKNYKDHHKVLGITPEEIGKLAIKGGVPTILDYFTREVAAKVRNKHGRAKLITATNVFAHIENVNQVVKDILYLLKRDGVFISESHYLLPLIKDLQYDTIYHEHLRYYSLHSIKYLLERHNLEVFHAREIPTHGGSIRVYAAKKGSYPVRKSVKALLQKEKDIVVGKKALLEFKEKVVLSKLKLHSLLSRIKAGGEKIYGIAAPSRASTLINYTALDNGIIDYVLEIKGSYKIGNYMPGTLIPIVEESILYKDQPEYVILFAWHIAKELIPKIKEKGFKGKFIVPLPFPKIIK